MTKSSIASQDEELPILNVEQFRLSCDLRVLGWLCGGVHVQWEGDDKFPGVARLRWDGDVVLEEAGVAFGLRFESTLLVRGGLEEDIEGLTISGDCQSLESVVVVTSTGPI